MKNRPSWIWTVLVLVFFCGLAAAPYWQTPGSFTTLDVTGDTTLGGTLSVDGATSLTSPLYMTGDATRGLDLRTSLTGAAARLIDTSGATVETDDNWVYNNATNYWRADGYLRATTGFFTNVWGTLNSLAWKGTGNGDIGAYAHPIATAEKVFYIGNPGLDKLFTVAYGSGGSGDVTVTSGSFTTAQRHYQQTSVAVATSITAQSQYEIYKVTANVNIELPDPTGAGIKAGQAWGFKATAAGCTLVSSDDTGADNVADIDGAASLVIGAWDFYEVYTDGTNWFIK